MAKYTEQNFEEHIEQSLLEGGYIKRSPSDYDKSLCLIPEEAIEFIKSTQAREYKKLEAQYGSKADDVILSRIASEVDKRGVLAVLRGSVKDRGATIRLAFFKPANDMNAEHREQYGLNRFSVVRQLKYSRRNENSLDMVLFLNGLPIITAELKNSLTGQMVEDAVKQYRQDRDPKEPLFAFKRCLVHFAVGNEKVSMTTRLSGYKTRFLPFNQDTENPINPDGHKTAYLWEDIWQKDTLLDLIENYLCIQKTTEKYFDNQKGLVENTSEAMIFPRFHQLDCVRRILAALKTEGTGSNYLVQHSAGSGKSNTIAWLAHKLASYYQHTTDHDRLFDSIIVITDRCILDKQLQGTIKQFERTDGVVCEIDINSSQLKAALENGKSIIISTIQKFAVISEVVSELKGSRFAVIVDEAHTSQSGESAKNVKQALSANLEEAEKEQEEEDKAFDVEEQIRKEIQHRGRQEHLSYFAFTATPKNKTLELFGRKDAKGEFRAFHNYWMRQAIEEGFILDVLKNYTTLERLFKLAKIVEEDEKFEKKKAYNLLTSYVDLQEYAVETRIRIILEHFLAHTAHAISGKGRAMIVTRSRLHAVRYYKTLVKVMKEQNLPYSALVAFSGTVIDPDSGEESTETSLNKLGAKVSIKDAFKMPEYRFLVVASKFQTGFDEPHLHTMYVDKKLGGVNAVQTLSRLNRTASGKDGCIVIDFMNDAEDIQQAFQPYYQATSLSQESDPNKLYDIETELNAYRLYNQNDIDCFAEVFFNPAEPQEKLQPILDRAVRGWLELDDDDERKEFRSLLNSFVRMYGFMSQVVTFTDIGLEKLYVFTKSLLMKLPKIKNPLPWEVIEAVDLDSFRIQKTYEGEIRLEAEDGETAPIASGKPKKAEEEYDYLSAIVETLNENFGLDLTEVDKVEIGRMREKLEEDKSLLAAVSADNTPDNVKIKFNAVVDRLLEDFIVSRTELFQKLSEGKTNAMLKSQWFKGYMSHR